MRMRLRLRLCRRLLFVLDSVCQPGARTELVGCVLYEARRRRASPLCTVALNHFTSGWIFAVDLGRAVMRCSRARLAQMEVSASGSPSAVRPPTHGMESADAMRVANQNGSLGWVEVLILGS